MKTRTITLIRPTVAGEQLRGPNDQAGNVPVATARPYAGRSLVWCFENGTCVSELDAFYWSPPPRGV